MIYLHLFYVCGFVVFVCLFICVCLFLGFFGVFLNKTICFVVFCGFLFLFQII